jgi:hypothetical protein
MVVSDTQRREEIRKAAQSLGRLGGLKGGLARAVSLTPERRSEIARMGWLAKKRNADARKAQQQG